MRIFGYTLFCSKKWLNILNDEWYFHFIFRFVFPVLSCWFVHCMSMADRYVEKLNNALKITKTKILFHITRSFLFQFFSSSFLVSGKSLIIDQRMLDCGHSTENRKTFFRKSLCRQSMWFIEPAEMNHLKILD